MTLFEIQWKEFNATLSDEELETFKIDPKELNPTLSTNYRNGIALFAVRTNEDEGYCAKKQVDGPNFERTQALLHKPYMINKLYNNYNPVLKYCTVQLIK